MSTGDVHDLVRAIGRLEGKIDGLLTAQRQSAEREVTFDARLRTVEQRLGSLLGWAAGAGAAASLILSLILRVIT